MSNVEVQPAQEADIAALTKVLGRAFVEDPLLSWILPDVGARRRRLHRVFGVLTRYQHFSRGGVEIASTGATIGAAALWDPPGQWRHSAVEGLRAAPSLMLALGTGLRRGLWATELMKRVHPEEPHWYLALIGSDPQVRGGGLGRALMQSRLDRCDAEHAPAYLESSNEANVPYYGRFGFEVTEEIPMPGGGPSVWGMWRRPR